MKLSDSESRTLKKALRILEKRSLYCADPVQLLKPEDVTRYLKLRMSTLEREVFLCLFLDAHNKLIAVEELFQGTLDSASVYPREVVKEVLKHNAAAVIFAHNHPSGNAGASNADMRITNRLRDALALIDVRVLDHVIVGGGTSAVYSFAKEGLL